MKLPNWIYTLILVGITFLFLSSQVVAGELSVRLSEFPRWEHKPNVSVAVGDLIYPQWFAGTWEMNATLVDMVAPLAPDLVTPGFEGNRVFLDKSVITQVRFINLSKSGFSSNYLSLPNINQKHEIKKPELVADRAFNGLNLARAYLGKDGVVEVSVDQNNPNNQVTLLKGDRQLTSIITGRKTETPNPQQFLTTEIFQQIFQSRSQVYLNEVETTSEYHYQPDRKSLITGYQVTAIYFSPQDPDYFRAKDKPVALYRYHLDFVPVATRGNSIKL
ncbi:DUF6816 family protein [Merismopedia glauca]|uniref:DUF6816 domain-containing protein n=1 Tax=Merismopedia glauca CCAP 1448/3 TaxID=1296344 RepID=A0A2T1C0W7_9CYAN|nr:hypothetical protein [Merismopedia glauca]PSB01882.1 hypothetical protein C7B64_16065 [Merismopedia glauca CCAP 1448/3]